MGKKLDKKLEWVLISNSNICNKNVKWVSITDLSKLPAGVQSLQTLVLIPIQGYFPFGFISYFYIIYIGINISTGSVTSRKTCL